MIKKLKIKRLTSIFLVFLLFINSFMLYAGDNDGSSFITKAEFDSLKNSFQSQLNEYNTGLDAKVDAAIAAYLKGAVVSSKARFKMCSTGVSYPLTLRHLGPYEGANVDGIATLDDGQKLWTDTLYFDGNAQRHALSQFTKDTLKKIPNNTIKNFYNGARSGSNYKISNILKNYDVTLILNTCWHNWSMKYTTVEYWNWYIFLDEINDDDAGGQTRNDTYSRTTRINATNTRRLTFPATTRPVYVGNWSQYTYSNKNAITKKSNVYTSVTDGSQKWDQCAQTSGFQAYVEHCVNWVDWEQSASYDTGDLNDILISVPSSAGTTEVYLPVLYDGKIKVTNINNAKVNLTGDNMIPLVQNCNGTETYPSPTHVIQGVVDAGFVVDAENNKATGAEWYDTSLIQGTRLIYDMQLPYTNKNVECQMGKGILLAEMPEDVESIELSIKPTWDTSLQTAISEKKYIMFSKNPIDEDITNITASLSPNNYIDISDSKSSSATKYKIMELTNGSTNNIYIGNMKKGDLLYYKITWGYDSSNSDRWKETVNIDLPEGVYYSKG